MNAASQLLRILAIVGALAAGALYYLSSTKTGSSSQSMGGDTTAMAAQLKDAQAKVAAAEADVAKNAQALADAQSSANLADKTRIEAVNALDDATKKARDATNALSDKDAQIADLTTKAAAADDLQKQIADLKDQAAKLQAQIDAGPKTADKTAGDNGKGGTTTATAPAPVQLTPAAPAKVLGIDTKQWLIVLNVGTGDGVQKDSQLQLKVGDADLGTAVVRDSKDGLSTAAITSTGGMSTTDYSKIVTKNLNIQYQRVM
jgi:hypothetical protein